MTKRRNMAIIILLIMGVVALCVVEFGFKAKIRHQKRQYAAAQLNPQTNDIKSIVKFKNPYMGNNSNDVNLNANLPLATVPHTFFIHSTTRELDIRYTKSVQNLGIAMDQFRASLVYNSTANFALIDNLSAITFTFPGASYRVKRSQVESWYGVTPLQLANESTWNQAVQSKLSETKYVNRAFSAFFGETN